jgi:hypothetical protein
MKRKNNNLQNVLFFIDSIHKNYINDYSSKLNNINFQPNESPVVLTENGRFISTKLKEMINNIDYLHYKTELVVKDTSIKLDIYKPYSYDMKNIKTKTIIEIIKFMSYFCKTINQSFKDYIEIKLVLSPFKKELSKNEHLTAHNVNSGFTIRDYYKGESKVVIFREEEIVKVLIHELLHSFDLDSKSMGERYDLQFSKLFKKETAINLNESFTESFACLINVCLASIYISRKNKYLLSDTFIRLMSNERRYILVIGEKVGTYNMRNTREQTNITSYYVLKAINWLDIEDFAEYLINHNFTIGTYRDYAIYLGDKLNYNKNEINEMKFVGKRNENIKNNMSIRMSSIDILNI